MDRDKQEILHEWLLVRYRRGDKSALEELIRLWERPLFFFIRRLLEREEDAWDALQDMWMKVLRQLPTLYDSRSLAPWLYRIARNTAISQFRRELRYQTMDEPEFFDSIPAEEEANWEKANAQDLYRAIDMLSLEHREVVTLHFLEDFSIAEIAAITDTVEGTVKSRLFYAKRALRERLEAQTKGERDA